MAARGKVNSTGLQSSSNDAQSRHIRRLSELVTQQHAARREDWAEFRAREALLVGELQDFRGGSQSWHEQREDALSYEAHLDQEWKAERRRRLDLEARLEGVEQFSSQSVALKADARVARELQELQRQLEAARLGEDEAYRLEQHSENQVAFLREELDRANHAAERHFAESQLHTQAREAEVLGAAWHMSGELRTELNACRGERVRLGLSPPPKSTSHSTVAEKESSARKALEDLKGVRERYNKLLRELP